MPTARIGSVEMCPPPRVCAWVGVALLATGCWGNQSQDPPVHLQQNMDFQEKGDAQERNDFFADGRFMRTPPIGTVAVGHLHADDHLYRGLGADGKLADDLPAAIEFDEALLARGQERYDIYCAPCHGMAGRGDGPATRRGGSMAVMPVNFHIHSLQPAPLGYFFQVMTYGKGQMRSYAAQVPVRDRWAIAAWVRLLQVSHRATPSDISKDAIAQSDAGRPQ